MWVLQFAVTATKIMICVLRCPSLVSKLNCIYFGHRVSKKPNKDHRLWIRKDSAGSGKKALCLVNTVRYNATRSWCFHLSMLNVWNQFDKAISFAFHFLLALLLCVSIFFVAMVLLGLKTDVCSNQFMKPSLLGFKTTEWKRSCLWCTG